ncbi:hypothetical protein INT43_006311, partial [Umbelopsis isabellina]
AQQVIMRLAIYGGVSTLLAASVIAEAFRQRSNFYTACIFLSKSSACTLILLNVGIYFSIMVGRLLQAIFFGQLRPIEVEHLYERSWYAVTETCLAMTIFRDEFDIQFVIVFTTLLFLKIFHWLCQDRVEYMEQTPVVPKSFHFRMISLMSLLIVIDCKLASHAISTIMVKGPNMMIMFGFEYSILTSTMLSTIGKYSLNFIESRMEEPWETKSIFVFYLDLVTDFFKLVTYVVFFGIICNFYGPPLHIIRDVYVTFRSFIQKCRDLYRYRRATRNMNELYPDATAEDLQRMSDSTCIICRDEMHIRTAENNQEGNTAEQEQARGRNSDIPKKLPCGHIFHFGCLRSWLERQQSCPTCRRSVLPEAAPAAPTTPPPAANIPAAQPQAEQRPQTPGQQQQQQQQQQQPWQQPRPTPAVNDSWPFIDGRNGNAQPSSIQQGSGYRAIPPPPPPPPPPFGLTLNILRAMAAQSSGVQQQPNSGNARSSMQGHTMVPLEPLAMNSQLDSSVHHQLPDTLTDEQLKVLSTNSKAAIEERLRILETVQTQTFRSIQLLSQVLSAMPEEVKSEATEPVEKGTQDGTVPALSSILPTVSDKKKEKMPMDTPQYLSTPQPQGTITAHNPDLSRIQSQSNSDDRQPANNDSANEQVIKEEDDGSEAEYVLPQRETVPSNTAYHDTTAK